MKRIRSIPFQVSALAAYLVLCSVGSASLGVAHAAEFSSRQITEMLVKSQAGVPVDFTDRDLSDIDLSGLNFDKLQLLGADLFGADLTNTSFRGANLSEARLDRITIIGASFEEANLENATLLRPSGFRTIDPNIGAGVSFARANLKSARIFGRLNRSDFSGADLTGATLSPFGKTGFIEHIWRTELLGARLVNTNLSGTDLRKVLFAFADMRNVNLEGADLREADLSRANLTGANLAGANLSGADFDGAVLRGVRGLESAIGFADAKNTTSVIR